MQYYDYKIKNPTEDRTAMIASIMDQIKISKSSTDKKDHPRVQYTTTVVPDNKKDPQSEGGNSTRNGVMWNLKHDISSPRFYEILIKTELKGDTSKDLKNFYNTINMCLNAVNILQRDLLTAYHSIKRNSYFE